MSIYSIKVLTQVLENIATKLIIIYIYIHTYNKFKTFVYL
jgi:hypothetical protein